MISETSLDSQNFTGGSLIVNRANIRFDDVDPRVTVRPSGARATTFIDAATFLAAGNCSY